MHLSAAMRSYDTLIHYPTNFDASLWLTRLLSYVYRAHLMRDRRKLLLICSLASSYGAVHLDTATFVRVPNRPEAEPKFFDHFRTCLYPQNVVQNTKGSIFCSLKTLGKGFRSTRTFKMHLKRASRDINPNLDAVRFYILASFYPIKKLSCQFVPLMKRSRLARQIVIRLTPASASPVVRK